MPEKLKFNFGFLEEFICVLLLGVMAIVVFLQVVFRYILGNPLVWAEEVSTLLFAWVTFLGSAVGVKRFSHIAINAVVILFPPRVRIFIQIAVDVLVIFLLVTFIKSGLELVMEGRRIATSTLGISQSYVYLSGPVGGLLMLYHYIVNIFRLGTQLFDKKGSF